MATPSTWEEVRAIRRANYPVAMVEYLRPHRWLLTLTDAGGCECAPGVSACADQLADVQEQVVFKPPIFCSRCRGAPRGRTQGGATTTNILY
jgi:hypothetical protein